MTPISSSFVYQLFAVVLLFVTSSAFADDSIEKENKDLFRRFVELYNVGEDEEFHAHASVYEAYLKEHGHIDQYYKIKTNEGLFDAARLNVFRAMKTAEQMEKEMHLAQDSDFYYLSTGLKADIHKAVRSPKADSIYLQALVEAGDRDPKFSMLVHLSLAQVNYLTAPDKSLEWANRALQESERLKSMEFRSMSLGIKSYVYFMTGKKDEFMETARQYDDLKVEFDSLNAHGKMRNQHFDTRYAAVMDVARMAFNGEFEEALQMVERRQINVDKQLVTFCIHGMEGTYEKDRSIKKLTWWLIVLTSVYIFVYIMGRRRLMRKIWKRNAELRVAMENAETANRMKAAFIRSMSHEIRTPLNAINGFTQVLCSDLELSAEEKTDIVQRITSSSEAITIIINELLELSAGESVTIDIDDLLPVHVNEVCRKVMVEAEKDNEKKLKMNFYTTIPDDFTIKSNEETVGKILTKIVDNAMKFTDKGHVDINVSNRDNYVEISVEDTGVGIPEEQHEAIFENFVKLDDFKNGAGLGLSICRRLVKLLGGRIFIDSQYNIGSRFVVQLPTNGTPLE